MNEREALLRAIIEHPDDDTPRLVFADWLQEHGEEERAEFIRVQVECDRGTPGGRFRRPYDSRSIRLLEEHEIRWRAELPEDSGFNWGQFHRGFVDRLFIHRSSCKVSSEYFPIMLDTSPIQDLGISGAINCREVLAWPGLTRLKMLEFYMPQWSDDDWFRLADCASLREGMELMVSGDYPPVAALERLESRFKFEWAPS